jgi:3-oxoacyl-[acyl-carrier protein] reductase
LADGSRGASEADFLHDRDEVAEQVAERVRGLGRRALALPADLGDPAAAAAVVQAAVDSFGPINILVNNAGLNPLGSLERTSVADFDRLVAVDTRGPFLMMQAAAGTSPTAGGW